MDTSELKKSSSKYIIKNIVFLALLLVAPFATCGPKSIKEGTVYSRSLMYHVAYFYRENKDQIVFGEKQLGIIATYRISGFSLYDDSGKEVGRISGGFNDANVTFFDDMYKGDLNGRYTIDY